MATCQFKSGTYQLLSVEVDGELIDIAGQRDLQIHRGGHFLEDFIDTTYIESNKCKAQAEIKKAFPKRSVKVVHTERPWEPDISGVPWSSGVEQFKKVKSTWAVPILMDESYPDDSEVTLSVRLAVVSDWEEAVDNG